MTPIILVTIVHIKGTAKNAADEKLRQSIRRFADEHKPPATIILITGDVNFAPEISDLKNRKKYNVILIYPEQVK
jgi:meiosis arrest female protein 1